jgi:uncharacterized protein
MRFVTLAVLASILQAQPAAPPEVTVTKDVMITMRDGVKLATDIYRPAGSSGAKLPVLMTRTPYNKDAGAGEARTYAASGYIVIVQDVRGRYKSEGRWIPIKDDPQDGFDTAKWIGEQPWFGGGIGTYGSSYNGATQHALAIANAPHVKAMIPRNAMSNFGHYGLRHNGAFELRWFNWVMVMGNPGPNVADTKLAAQRAALGNPEAAASLADLSNRVQEYVRALPLRAGTTPLKFAPDYEAWLIEAMQHGDYDDFWKNHGSSVVDHIAEYKDIPVYHVTGWYDSWGTSVANLSYPQLKKAKKGPQRLIVGPWIHSSERLSYAGEAQFTPDAALNMPQFHLRWFDRWLKETNNGVDREPLVRIYVMGGGDGHKTPEGRLFVGGKWREEQEWPLARTQYTPYYLHPNGRLSPKQPALITNPVTYQFDPKDPVPTLGGNVSSQGELMFQGAADQRCRKDFWLCPGNSKPLSTRNDIVVFQTEPLTQDIEVTGRLVVKLWASSNGPDTDFTAKLIDVYPPNKDFPAGVDLSVGDSIVRARYRKGPGKPAEMLKPGAAEEFNIEMYPTSLVFKKGHRIRLDISSSNFPRFDVNPNTGEPLNGNRRTRVAENTIYLDSKRPSQIVLPVIPLQ